MGIDGFEFVEFAAPAGRASELHDQFKRMGFSAVLKHKTRPITVYRQNGVNFLVNEDPDSFAADFAKAHGPSACGFGIRFRKPDVQVLQTVLDTIPSGGRVVHCCAPNPPLDLLRDAGANAIAVDAALLRSTQYDALGAAVDAGVSLWLGVLPATDTAITLDTARDPLLRLWRELGFAESALADAVVPTPAGGLAGANAAYVRRALSVR